MIFVDWQAFEAAAHALFGPRRGWQRRAAELIGVHPSTVSRWKRVRGGRPLAADLAVLLQAGSELEQAA